jgi:hypothetical protein
MSFSESLELEESPIVSVLMNAKEFGWCFLGKTRPLTLFSGEEKAVERHTVTQLATY